MSTLTLKDLALAASRPSARDARVLIDNYKVSNGCSDCGYADHPAALHFDHRDPATKYRTAMGRAVHPADMIKAGRDGMPRYSWATILGELSKCDVRCANCHAERTTRQRENAEADAAYIDRYGIRSWLAWSAGDARGGF